VKNRCVSSECSKAKAYVDGKEMTEKAKVDPRIRSYLFVVKKD
jgi:hypothetical protein